MVFAPSGDLTDDPGIVNLYIADSGLGKNPRPGVIVEFSLSLTQAALAMAQAEILAPAAVTASLVSTIRTSSWSPPSPDADGASSPQWDSDRN
jgi:hypothetical protein